MRRVFLSACVPGILLGLLAGPAQAVLLDNEPLMYWNFNNYSLNDSSYTDLVAGVKIYDTLGTTSPVFDTPDGSEAVDFGASGAAFLQNTSTGINESLVGAYCMELEFRIPASDAGGTGQYLAGFGTPGAVSGPTGPASNMQYVIYGYQGTEVEVFGRPRTNNGPTTLNDGAWHKLVVASYGNQAGSQGYMDKLVYSVDEGPLQTFSRESGDDFSALDLRAVAVGAATGGGSPFGGCVDNFAVYDLSVSVADPDGDVEAQLDAAVTAIASNQQRELGGGGPPTPDPLYPPTTAYGYTVLKDNPRFYWSFNEETADSEAEDVVRRQYNDRFAPNNDATRAASGSENLGQAASFDGDADFFRAAGLNDGEMPGAWAVEMWVKPDGDRKAYLMNAIGSSTNNPGLIYGFNTDTVEAYCVGGRTEDSGPTISDDEWHHVVYTFYGNDGGFGVADRMDIALDGVVQTVDRGGFSSALTTSTEIIFGAALSSGVDAFGGKLDELAFYDLSDLTEAEVAAKTQVIADHYGLMSQSAETDLAFVEDVTYTIDASTQPHSGYADVDGVQLADGVIGSTMPNGFGTGEWVGFQNNGAIIVFDLGESTTLDSLFVDYCVQQRSGIYAPDSVTVEFSDDGTTFSGSILDDGFNDFDPTAGSDIGTSWVRRLVVDLEGNEAQYVRLTFANDMEWTFLGEMQFLGGTGGTTPSLEGDLNGDGTVNSGDLDLVRGNWGSVVAPNTNGDANGDGFVNSGDLDIVRGNWGASLPASVPEPGIGILLGLAVLLSVSIRRR